MHDVTMTAVDKIKAACTEIDDCIIDRSASATVPVTVERFLCAGKIENSRSRKQAHDIAILHEVSGEPLSLLVNGHFDLSASALVKDRKLGTLGLLQVVPSKSEMQGSITAWCRERVDEAVHLRHLLLTATRNAQVAPRPLAYTVELVFCMPAEPDWIDGEVGTALRELYREGSLLHAVGINLWQVESQPVSRGLPWLLTATRAALHNVWKRRSPNSSEPLALDRLQLTNFRVAGQRRIDFGSGSRVHVVHGPNGSGKSSIVEALELLCTGRIARLESGGEKPDYARILRNRYAPSGDAQIIAIGGNGKSEERSVTSDGISRPLGDSLNGDAIRLNQELADRLSASSSGLRAETFLRAFFSEQLGDLTNLRDAHMAFEAAWARMPAWAKAEAMDEEASPPNERGVPAPDPRTVLRRLAWQKGPTIDWEHAKSIILRAWLLTDLPSRRSASSVVQSLSETGSYSWPETLRRIAELDDAMTPVRTEASALVKLLPPAMLVLDALRSHVARDPKERVAESIPRLFDQWLQAIAESDVATRLRDATATIRSLDASGKRTLVSGQLEEMLRSLTRDCDEHTWQTSTECATFLRAHAESLASQLAGSSVRQTAGERTSAPVTSLPRAHDFAALDRIAWHGLLGDELMHCQPPLGEAARRTIEQGLPLEVLRADGLRHDTGLGWIDKSISTLHAEQGALEQILETEHVGSLPDGFERLAELRAAAQKIDDTDATTEQTLVDMLTKKENEGGHLLAALNEVKAMLTPAPWAYRPLYADVRLKQEQRFDLVEDDPANGQDTTPPVPITQRLNTAELNILALSFFLICARRVDNPLRLIVLDDPLQNMDEMTVTTVARAIGRLVRLWDVVDPPPVPGEPANDRWRILLLLHGQDDVERIRTELPCIFHQLPWLGSVREKDLSPMQPTRDGSLLSETLQHLDTMIAWAPDDATPPAAQVDATA